MEVAKGWIKEGNNARELAVRIGIDPEELHQTIEKYNRYCGETSDPDFARSKETLKALNAGPLYAVELWPRMVNTMGGPRRDANARVINKAGQAIPRLLDRKSTRLNSSH